MTAVNLGCMDNDNRFSYNLYVTTFLGYGVNEGLKKYEHTLLPKVITTNNSAGFSVPYVRDNCLPVKMMKVTSAENGTEFLRLGTGDWDSCVSEIVSILKQAGDCSGALKCFFDGVEAPPVDLSSIDLFGFSEYWYSMHDVLALGGIYHHEIFEKGARKFCTTDWEKIKVCYYRIKLENSFRFS
jgi:ectonucleoside triphosphate diphosphohydrolase 4